MTELRDQLDLGLQPRGSKPRVRGLTHVADAGMPMRYFEDFLEDLGPYIDSVKLAINHLFTPIERVKAKTALLAKYDISVQTSGTYLEIARARGRELKALEVLKEIGVTTVEVSASTGEARDMDDQVEFAAHAAKMGFNVVGEVGAKWPEGDTTRRAANQINVEETIRQMKAYLDAGVDHFYWEGALLKLVMGETPAEVKANRATALEQILPVVEEIGQDHIIFETTGLLPATTRRLMYLWFIRHFGPEVNLGNARIQDVGFLEGMRRGVAPASGMGREGAFPWIRSLVAGNGEPAERWWEQSA
jgi:phosphosulfolactate synthase